MAKPFLLSASILSADFSCLGEQILSAQQAGIDWVHIDVMDGHFVPNLTMGPFIVAACRQITSLPLDVHLMIDNPERLLQAFAEAGATTLSVHVENTRHLHRTLQEIRELGCKPGVVLNPSTPASLLTPILHMVDLVLVMTVNPGYSGQAFISEVVPKIACIRQELDRLNPQAYIEVDGGVTPNTLPLVAQAGANVFVSATSIFKVPAGIAAGVQALKAAFPVN